MVSKFWNSILCFESQEKEFGICMKVGVSNCFDYEVSSPNCELKVVIDHGSCHLSLNWRLNHPCILDSWSFEVKFHILSFDLFYVFMFLEDSLSVFKVLSSHARMVFEITCFETQPCYGNPRILSHRSSALCEHPVLLQTFSRWLERPSVRSSEPTFVLHLAWVTIERPSSVKIKHLVLLQSLQTAWVIKCALERKPCF